jgi:hypothetical protein
VPLHSYQVLVRHHASQLRGGNNSRWAPSRNYTTTITSLDKIHISYG